MIVLSGAGPGTTLASSAFRATPAAATGGLPERHLLLGRSSLGRPSTAVILGRPSPRRTLVVGCIHGSECIGMAITQRLEAGPVPRRSQLWIVDDLNPDGLAAGTRLNGRGVDLNRNFPSEWRPNGRRWDPEYSEPRPFPEPETRIAYRLILRLRPELTIWLHQPQALCAPGDRASRPPAATHAWPTRASGRSAGRPEPPPTGRTTASRGRARSSSSSHRARYRPPPRRRDPRAGTLRHNRHRAKLGCAREERPSSGRSRPGESVCCESR